MMGKQRLIGCFVEAAAEAETQRSYKGYRYNMGWTPRVKTKRERMENSEAGPKSTLEHTGNQAEASDSESSS